MCEDSYITGFISKSLTLTMISTNSDTFPISISGKIDKLAFTKSIKI